MGPQEPYWRTNSSFSPPPSRWDFRLQPEGLSFGSREGSQLYGSSTSSNSRGSRSWSRGNYLPNHQYNVSDGVAQYFSSPSEISPAYQWTPPTIQEISVDDYGNSSRRVLGPLSFSPTLAATSVVHDSVGSTSSRSDSSDYEPVSKSHTSHRNVSSRRSFMSKPVHPVSFPFEREPTGFHNFDSTTPRRDRHHFISDSCDIEFTDTSSPIESNVLNHPRNSSDSFKCGLCERFLSQRSPWSSRRIVRSGDMPVAGVLSCLHVFHAECLEQTTPKPRKNDPPCPICAKFEEENITEQRVCSTSKLRNGIPRLRPFREEGPSRQWGCTQTGDCVEGALNQPQRNAMLLLNRNCIKKNLALKGNFGKEIPGKLRKSGPYSSHVFDQGVDGCSKSVAGASSSMKG